jgi:TonB family protein
MRVLKVFVVGVVLFAGVPVFSQTQSTAVSPPESVSEQFLMVKVRPIYPPLAKQAGIQGKVVLRVLIGALEWEPVGYVKRWEILSGDPTLAQAAIDAVKKWQYNLGKPVPVDTQITLTFTLSDQGSTSIQLGNEEIPSGMQQSSAEITIFGLTLGEPMPQNEIARNSVES